MSKKQFVGQLRFLTHPSSFSKNIWRFDWPSQSFYRFKPHEYRQVEMEKNILPGDIIVITLRRFMKNDTDF